jgi:hypothetical protein
MGLGFLVFEDTADPRHDRSLLLLQRTTPPAPGTGVLQTQLISLLRSGHFQGAGQQGLHRGHRDFFHLREIDIQPGSLLAPVLPHDDFSPATGQFLDPTNIL